MQCSVEKDNAVHCSAVIHGAVMHYRKEAAVFPGTGITPSISTLYLKSLYCVSTLYWNSGNSHFHFPASRQARIVLTGLKEVLFFFYYFI